MYVSEASSVIESMELLPETSLQIFGGGAGQFSIYCPDLRNTPSMGNYLTTLL